MAVVTAEIIYTPAQFQITRRCNTAGCRCLVWQWAAFPAWLRFGLGTSAQRDYGRSQQNEPFHLILIPFIFLGWMYEILEHKLGNIGDFLIVQYLAPSRHIGAQPAIGDGLEQDGPIQSLP